MEQPGAELNEELNEELDEVETDVLEPNCDTIDPDAWASESEVDSCNAERSTTLVVAPPPEMEGANRHVKTKYSLRRRVEPPERLCRLSLESSSNYKEGGDVKM